MSDTALAVAFGHVPQIRTFFDQQYAAHERYWWRGENRYSIDPVVHNEFHAALLAAAARRGPGVALDLGQAKELMPSGSLSSAIRSMRSR